MAIEEDLRVELVLVVDPSTIEDLPTSVRYLHREVGGVFFILSFNIDTQWTSEDLAHLASSYNMLGQYYVEQFEAGHPVQIDFLNNKINVLLRGGFIREGLCRIGGTDLAVTPDGAIYPCLRLAATACDGAMSIGNVADGLDWHATRELRSACQSVREHGGLPTGCNSCRHSESCLNWCVAANLATSGTPTQPGAIMCQYERVCIGVAKQVMRRISRAQYLALYADYLPNVAPALAMQLPAKKRSGNRGVETVGRELPLAVRPVSAAAIVQHRLPE